MLHSFALVSASAFTFRFQSTWKDGAVIGGKASFTFSKRMQWPRAIYSKDCPSPARLPCGSHPHPTPPSHGSESMDQSLPGCLLRGLLAP